jgi:hypothetical protein
MILSDDKIAALKRYLSMNEEEKELSDMYFQARGYARFHGFATMTAKYINQDGCQVRCFSPPPCVRLREDVQ